MLVCWKDTPNVYRPGPLRRELGTRLQQHVVGKLLGQPLRFLADILRLIPCLSLLHNPKPSSPPNHPAKANNTFIDDPEMAARLMQANPNSFRKLVATFLEANGRGYWEASEDQIEKLRQM